MENNENSKVENYTTTDSNQDTKTESTTKKPFKRQFSNKRKSCKICAEKIKHVDYKQFHLIKPYCTETGRILPRKVTGVCAKHQRQLARAIKINRNLALLPYND